MRAIALLACAALVACASGGPRAGFANSQSEVAEALRAAGRDARDLERDARDHPAVTLGLAGLSRGMRVLDLFSGGGYYAEIAARVVGAEGRVYAHNNRAYLSFAGEAFGKRLAARPLEQLVRHEREIEALGLAGEIDLALVVLASAPAMAQKHGGTGTTIDWPRAARIARARRVVRGLRPRGGGAPARSSRSRRARRAAAGSAARCAVAAGAAPGVPASLRAPAARRA